MVVFDLFKIDLDFFINFQVLAAFREFGKRDHALRFKAHIDGGQSIGNSDHLTHDNLRSLEPTETLAEIIFHFFIGGNFARS